MTMDASKISAFISGSAVALTGMIVESNSWPFFWVAEVFLPSVFVFVIGFEIWRELVKGEHIGFPMGPKDKEGWAIYGRAWFRMFIWFIGAATTGIVVSTWQSI